MECPKNVKPVLSRRDFVKSGLEVAAVAPFVDFSRSIRTSDPRSDDRATWVRYLKKVSEPVLTAINSGRLHATMPVEAVPGHEAERRIGTHLEAFARLLAGISPWLELDDPDADASESALRRQFRQMAAQGIANAVNPASPDYMHFGESGQTLVDSSFLSLALLRAPKTLIKTLSATTQNQLLAALDKTRAILPPFNNWLLFAALNELLRRQLGTDWDRLRVDYALRELDSWYLGDGTYGDGPNFHADFYNSYVMHPYLLQIADIVSESAWSHLIQPIRDRATRYAAIQERLISPNGEFPVLGRSICYRGGAFHLLADAALRKMLGHLTPGSVRAALGAVQARTLDPAGTFMKEGWLRIGLAGAQPSLAETYISTGSLYLCSVLWLPLGLPTKDAFWSEPGLSWTQRRIWAGEDAMADHALDRSPAS